MKDESPILEEVRERALGLSKRFRDDLRAYAEHLRELEAKNIARVVSQITVVRSSASREKTQ